MGPTGDTGPAGDTDYFFHDSDGTHAVTTPSDVSSGSSIQVDGYGFNLLFDGDWQVHFLMAGGDGNVSQPMLQSNNLPMWINAEGELTLGSSNRVRIRAEGMKFADNNGTTLWQGTMQDMANALTPPIKIQKFSKSVTIGANAFTTTDLGTISVPTGYNFLGIVANENGYGDQWLVSYSWYGGKCQAMIHSRHNASLTKTLIARAIFIRSDLNT